MDERIAKIEVVLEEVKSRLNHLESDIRELRKEMNELRREMHTNFKFCISILISTFVATIIAVIF